MSPNLFQTVFSCSYHLHPFYQTDWRTVAVVTTFQYTTDHMLVHHIWGKFATTVWALSTPLPTTWLWSSGQTALWLAEDSELSLEAHWNPAQVQLDFCGHMTFSFRYYLRQIVTGGFWSESQNLKLPSVDFSISTSSTPNKAGLQRGSE